MEVFIIYLGSDASGDEYIMRVASSEDAARKYISDYTNQGKWECGGIGNIYLNNHETNEYIFVRVYPMDGSEYRNLSLYEFI